MTEARKPKRYDLEWTGGPYTEYREMLEHELGDWVRWEDVEHLFKEEAADEE